MYKYLFMTLLVTLFVPALGQEQNRPQRLVVAEFTNKTGEEDLDWIGLGLRVELTRRLMRAESLVVSDTPAFNRIRNELGLVKRDLSEPGIASEIARELGAQKVVVGEFVKAPTGITVSARIISVENSEAIGDKTSATGSPTAVTAELANALLDSLNIEPEKPGKIGKNLTTSSDAFEEYCRGLMFKGSEETYEKAISHFIKASETDENFAAPHFELGWLFTITGPGMYRSAMKEYKKAISLYPEYAEAYNNLGLIHSRLEEPQTARSAYLKAIEIIPNYVDAHFNLGRLYDILEQYDEAIAQYKKAIELNPTDAVVHNNLAVAYLNKGEDEKAKESYSAALKLKPDLKEAHFGLGLIYDNQGDTDMARRHYQKFIDLGGYDEAVSQRLEQLKKEDK